MAIVNGVYEEKISTTYRTVSEGVEQIKVRLGKARKVRIGNVPLGLLDKLRPLLKGKDVKLILPRDTKPTVELMEIGPVAIQKAKIYKDHKGVEAELGSIYVGDTMFSIAWENGKILEIDAMGYAKCVKCMKGAFETAWRYSEKVKH